MWTFFPPQVLCLTIKCDVYLTGPLRRRGPGTPQARQSAAAGELISKHLLIYKSRLIAHRKAIGMTAGGNYFCSIEGRLNVHGFFVCIVGEKHWTN